MASAKILVSGATGHVGYETVKVLSETGRPVVATDLPGADWSCLEGLDIEKRPADLLHPASCAAVLKEIGAIIHTVGLIDISRPYDQLYAVNYGVTRNLLKASAGQGVEKLVFFSSASVCGKPYDTAIREEFPPRPKNGYEKTKVLAEQSVSEFAGTSQTRCCILRPSVVYGPRGHLLSPTAIMLGVLLKQTKWRVPRIRGGPASNWIHVRDVARAAVFLLDAGANRQVYHIANDTPLSLGELVDITFDALQVPAGRRFRFPGRLARFLAAHPPPDAMFALLNRRLRKAWKKLAARHFLTTALDGSITPGIVEYGLGNFVFSNDKIKKQGFVLQYPEFEDSWRETIRWYQKNRWIP